jgi:hypothetical protein
MSECLEDGLRVHFERRCQTYLLPAIGTDLDPELRRQVLTAHYRKLCDGEHGGPEEHADAELHMLP